MGGSEPAPLFADATFFVALFNTQDRHHAAARDAIVQVAERTGPVHPIIYTDYVFDEVVTTILGRTRRHSHAARAGRMLMAGKVAQMIQVSRATFDAAFELFLARPDKRWSFTDCTSFSLMEAMGINTALSFDTDFRAAGFNTMPP